MRQVYAPIRAFALFKSFFAIFGLQALVVILTPYEIISAIRLQVLVFNFLSSAVLGWYLYKHMDHLVFSYDDEGFALRKGTGSQVAHKWRDFSHFSLARTEHGEFSVRLYKDDEYLDIPASKLKIDPFKFRYEVMNLVQSQKA